MYIDTHCHLNYPELYQNRAVIIKRAKAAQVNRIITIGTDLESSRQSLSIADEFPNVYAAAGIHPTDLLKVNDNWKEELRKHLNHEKVVAVGEIGLDYYWDTTKPEDQKHFFAEQIEIARESDLPMIIHNRRADQDMHNLLAQHNYFNGVLHCYSSDEHFAETMLDLGLLLSFTGNVTYGSKKLERVIRTVPLEKIMLETDAPFITPVPHKGETNEPAFIPLIARRIAEIKEIPVSVVASTTTQTACRFFGLDS